MSRPHRPKLDTPPENASAGSKLNRVRQVLREFAPAEESGISEDELEKKTIYASKSLKNIIMPKKKSTERRLIFDELREIKNKYAVIIDILDSYIAHNFDSWLFNSKNITRWEITPPSKIFPSPPTQEFYFSDEIIE